MSADPGAVPAGLPGVTRWRKRPIEVDAVQVLESHGQEVEAFLAGAWCEWIMADPERPGASYRLEGLRLWVAKSDAVCTLRPGDWIIREADDSGFYPCAESVFAATYEPAGEPLVMPADEFAAVQSVARAFGAVKPCGCGPDEPCDAHAEKDPPGSLHEVADAFLAVLLSADQAVSAQRDRADAAEAKLAEVRGVLLVGGQDAGTVRRRALAIIGAEEESRG